MEAGRESRRVSGEVAAYSDARIRGNEAIISAFNPGWKNPNLYDDQVRGTASFIAAIKKAGIKRVLWVSGAGGLEAKPGVRVIGSPDMPLWVKPGSWRRSTLWTNCEKSLNLNGPSVQVEQ
jgi:putative NADH-flavin reductase